MTTILKIGGSLEADPARLRALLAEVAECVHGRCIVVPGGGAFADAVRADQIRDGFDDAEAHRRALDAMGRMAVFFRSLEPRLVRSVAPWADDAAACVWDPVSLRAGHPDIPESWDVTSDSLALWLAARLRAGRCVLVKSADAAADESPALLAQRGLVDAAFPAFAMRYGGPIAIWGPTRRVTLQQRVAA
ncbi:uridylate kinase [Methylobacterium sp. J-072]|uniref:amino acid kinase family protein n=1 Tax=Methylobacterium sp. J-072 TaxID=2836651 RepID=UPI001FB8AC8C|nr:uridylate kinase [Methylobacterium sp. J-072]MCJ2096794.1 uridylate kinase [Methylobacterium sp. J-072]